MRDKLDGVGILLSFLVEIDLSTRADVHWRRFKNVIIVRDAAPTSWIGKRMNQIRTIVIGDMRPAVLATDITGVTIHEKIELLDTALKRIEFPRSQ